jgi:hypothetical protein
MRSRPAIKLSQLSAAIAVKLNKLRATEISLRGCSNPQVVSIHERITGEIASLESVAQAIADRSTYMLVNL